MVIAETHSARHTVLEEAMAAGAPNVMRLT
jgi:hypothetical protein